MKTHSKITALLLAAALSLGMLSGCAAQEQSTADDPSDSSQTAQKTGIETFVIGTTMDIQSISRGDYYYNVLTGTLSHMALVRLDDKNQMQPLLAKFSTEDSKTWSFRIKEGLTWHDGQPVTAEDVRFTLDYLAEKEPSAKIEKMERIEVVDDRTVRLVYRETDVRALNDLTALRILPKHIFETVEDYSGFQEDQAAIGCGPYRFVRFDPAAGVIEFEAYENFVDGAPNISRILVKLFKNTDTMYMALKAGEIDMVYFYAGGVDTGEAEDLERSGNIKLSVIQDTSVPLVLSFNSQKEPVNNPAVRKAIAAAVDYAKCRELFGSPYSTASTYGFVPKGTDGFVETPELVRDVEQAKKLLAQAGAADSDGDGIVELGGKPLNLELMIRSDKPLYARVGELLQANLKEAGIGVTFKTVDVPTFRAMSETEHSNIAMVTKFTAFGMGMGAGMGSAYFDARYEGSGQGQVTDPVFAALADRMMTAETMEEYLAAAGECQKYYAENVPGIALFWDSYVQAYNNKYDGFVVDGTFGIVNQSTWYSITSK